MVGVCIGESDHISSQEQRCTSAIDLRNFLEPYSPEHSRTSHASHLVMPPKGPRFPCRHSVLMPKHSMSHAGEGRLTSPLL